MRLWVRVRFVANFINLSTPLGLLVALVGRARIRRGEHGLFYAHDFRIPTMAGAFTVGNVIVTGRPEGYLAGRLLAHEARHATQYVWCLGPPMLVLYLLAALVSLLMCGNPGSWNVFERRACLADGGYRDVPPWWRNSGDEITS
jgi:hypothetical protein